MEEIQIKSGREEVNREVNESFEGTMGHTTRVCMLFYSLLRHPVVQDTAAGCVYYIHV